MKNKTIKGWTIVDQNGRPLSYFKTTRIGVIEECLRIQNSIPDVKITWNDLEKNGCKCVKAELKTKK
jgi:hypothetical protein